MALPPQQRRASHASSQSSQSSYAAAPGPGEAPAPPAPAPDPPAPSRAARAKSIAPVRAAAQLLAAPKRGGGGGGGRARPDSPITPATPASDYGRRGSRAPLSPHSLGRPGSPKEPRARPEPVAPPQSGRRNSGPFSPGLPRRVSLNSDLSGGGAGPPEMQLMVSVPSSYSLQTTTTVGPDRSVRSTRSLSHSSVHSLQSKVWPWGCAARWGEGGLLRGGGRLEGGR